MNETATFTRAGLLRRGAVGGSVVLTGGALAFAAPAAAAAPPDEDLAYLRLLIGVELLAVDSQTRALASGKLSGASQGVVKEMLAQEQAHLAGLSALVAGAGQVPASADDVDFTYPGRSFGSAAAVAGLLARIEAISLGAYLGAVENVQTPQWRLPLGQIAASEAQHVAAVAALTGRPVLGRAFAPSLQIDAVSAALDAFES